MNKYKRVYAEIDLDALRHNLREVRRLLPENVSIAAVIKTDGYGHGAVPVARAVSEYVGCYCCATAEEAVNLRLHNIEKPILVLGPVPGDDYRDIVKYSIMPTVFTMRQAGALSAEAALLSKTVNVHIAVDTGMNRIGMKASKENIELVRQISGLPFINIDGVFTHMYSADEKDKSAANKQLDTFRNFIASLNEAGIRPRVKHISNSAGIAEAIGTDFDMVRAGIIMYGLSPSEDTDMHGMKLKPVMSIKSEITVLKEIEAGEVVSYGGVYRAKTRRCIATVPVGYGDGYPRELGDSGSVLVCGKRAPIAGRICMDQLMIDVSDIEEADIGKEVVLVGESEGERLDISELSAMCSRFPYEFICDISKRVPRVYLRKGVVVGSKDHDRDIYEDFLD